jgi:hypothetical protein
MWSSTWRPQPIYHASGISLMKSFVKIQDKEFQTYVPGRAISCASVLYGTCIWFKHVRATKKVANDAESYNASRTQASSAVQTALSLVAHVS